MCFHLSKPNREVWTAWGCRKREKEMIAILILSLSVAKRRRCIWGRTGKEQHFCPRKLTISIKQTDSFTVFKCSLKWLLQIRIMTLISKKCKRTMHAGSLILVIYSKNFPKSSVLLTLPCGETGCLHRGRGRAATNSRPETIQKHHKTTLGQNTTDKYSHHQWQGKADAPNSVICRHRGCDFTST